MALPSRSFSIARRSVAHERRADSGNAPRLGGQGARHSLKRLLSKEVRAEALRRWFREVFADTAIWKTLAKLSDDDLLEVAEGFREGIPFATPVFDGAREAENPPPARSRGPAARRKINLFDGMTGDQFDQPVTVGYIYMLKLSHLVDDKIHARSIGPYSLITQQPLGGKRSSADSASANGSVGARSVRRGAHPAGTAHGKSDAFTAARKSTRPSSRASRASSRAAGIVNVLVRELQSLCLDVELMKRQKPPTEKAAD